MKNWLPTMLCWKNNSFSNWNWDATICMRNIFQNLTFTFHVFCLTSDLLQPLFDSEFLHCWWQVLVISFDFEHGVQWCHLYAMVRLTRNAVSCSSAAFEMWFFDGSSSFVFHQLACQWFLSFILTFLLILLSKLNYLLVQHRTLLVSDPLHKLKLQNWN